MNTFALELISRYAPRGILIDTNILLLYFVGTTNPDRIARFKRTQTFVKEDYNVLVRIHIARERRLCSRRS